MALLTNPEKRAELREAALQRQRRRPGVPGRFIKWKAIVVSKAALEKNRRLEGRSLTELAEQMGKHVADVMLDLAVEEKLETEFLLRSRSLEEEAEMADYVKTGHAIPSQTDAGAHLNTNFCTAGESTLRARPSGCASASCSRWRTRSGGSRSSPRSIMGLRDRGLVREGMVADLMVFDLAKLGVKEDEITRDGPNGSPRRVQGATGVDYVVVGGQLVLDHGQHTGALPGRVLRATQR